MLRSRGPDLALPSGLNRPRVTALGATLLLHAIVVAWLLAQRFDLPPALVADARLIWQPSLPPPPPRPDAVPALPPLRVESITIVPWLEPVPDIAVPAFYDFEGTAKDVASAIGG